MVKEDKPKVFDLANPSRKILIVVGGLIFFVLFLIALSVALAVKFLEPAFQFVTIILLLGIPIFGLLLATWLIFRNLQTLSRNNKNEVWQLMSLEDQKRKFGDKVRKVSANTTMAEEQIKNLQIDYLAAEDLALRQIKQERKTSMTRHIKVADADFDAVFLSRNAFNFVEVVFLIEPSFSPNEFEELLKKTQLAKKKAVRLGLDSALNIR
ncbi:MAG: hypothetical protein LC778_06965 [Acidobacteria bacterium]|nr:hypothetical protein [Acidobacteriota bacterium]